MCQDSLTQNSTIPLDPLIAIGLFFTNRCLSICDHPYAGDPTIQYLYVLAHHYNQSDSQDIASLPSKVINAQVTEYDRLIMLANTLNQSLLAEALSEAKTRIYAAKRKYDDLLSAEASSKTTVTSNNKENDDLPVTETLFHIAAVVDQTTIKIWRAMKQLWICSKIQARQSRKS